jgi:hypothetical protein
MKKVKDKIIKYRACLNVLKMTKQIMTVLFTV